MDSITIHKLEQWFKMMQQPMPVDIVINGEGTEKMFNNIEEILSEYEGLDGEKIMYFPIG